MNDHISCPHYAGYIDVDSELDRGTTFTVYLPAARQKRYWHVVVMLSFRSPLE
jgi:hypothetical protein